MIKSASLVKLTLFGLSIFCVLQSGAAAAEFKVSGVSGPVTLVRDGESSLVKNGDTLQNGDQITTTGDSRLDIVSEGVWGYRLLQSSDCVIHAKKEGTEIEMRQGNVIFKVKPTQGRNLTVRTPVVIAGIRGTQFWGQVTPAGESHNSIFAVREGVVEMTVLESGEILNLEAGSAFEIKGESGDVVTREAKLSELEAISTIETLSLN